MIISTHLCATSFRILLAVLMMMGMISMKKEIYGKEFVIL